ncbi:mechanosensitive ion channel domain-containing protein [Chitinophaga sp.]|uniref:mechanosensitive ion channel domain-containing protein n=1 Tax=Chitinophaga sp. TaxID=1869181 RepID=UPI00261733F5|nr:mechanosensitive ion channel domain-containing protein [uncultured Chitinophaga sp.]
MIIRVYTLLCCLLLSAPASAQNSKTPISPDARQKTSDTVVTDAVERVENITKMLNRVNNTLRRGFDTTEISAELPESERLVKNLHAGILANPRLLNIRSLYALQVILLEMEQTHNRWQQSLSSYSRAVTDMSAEINNILHDTVLERLPKDPGLQSLYVNQLSQLNRKWLQADTANRNSLLRIGLLQNRVAMNYIAITDMLDEVDFKLKNAQQHIWGREENNLWDARPGDYENSFPQVLQGSIQATHRVFRFYLKYNWDIHLLNLALFLLYFGWLIASIHRIKKYHHDKKGIFGNTRYAARQPLLTSLIFILTVGPFLYTNPPIIFMVMLWTVLAVCVGLLQTREMPVWMRWQWGIMLAVYLGYALLNLLLQNSFLERWAQFFLQVAMLLVCWFFLKKQEQESGYNWPKYTRLVVYLAMAMFIAAMLTNLFGRVMLAKFFGISAVFGLISAQALVVLVQLLFETFYLHLEASKSNSRFAAFLDFNRIRESLRSTLYLLAAVAWFVILLRNLNIYGIIRDEVLLFLEAERKLGNTTFSFSSIFIFVAVIWIAFQISKVMMFIFGHQDGSGSVKKNRWNSAVLLIRLGVLGAGILLAFAAPGIPMDKLTIIIGALSVGIGFGLQNIVNNLVSGVILAFEKPVEIGDVVDIGTQSGTVKEIGIRASKIATVEGSVVIVPNGDLLSQHITNWTLTTQLKRSELIVGVAYGSDLKQAQALLEAAVKAQEAIQQFPAPLVVIHLLNDSSVDFRVLFWTDINVGLTVKSDLLRTIYDSLNSHGIEIPFPQQDVHIRGEAPPPARTTSPPSPQP